MRDAVDKGAKVLTGGKLREGEGTFWEPTVLTGVDHTMKCMTEETFGATLPIMRVDDEEEAIRLANDSPFGLDASVFGGDLERAERVARRIESGGVVVNDAIANYFATEIPLGGAKESGVGRAPRRDGHPEVLPAPEPGGHALRAEEGAVLLPVRQADVEAAGPVARRAVRSGPSKR